MKLAVKLTRHARRHKWPAKKLRFWQNFMMPPLSALRWVENQFYARIDTGRMAASINPHTGEQNGRTL
jgi:hypothetical protein